MSPSFLCTKTLHINTFFCIGTNMIANSHSFRFQQKITKATTVWFQHCLFRSYLGWSRLTSIVRGFVIRHDIVPPEYTVSFNPWCPFPSAIRWCFARKQKAKPLLPVMRNTKAGDQWLCIFFLHRWINLIVVLACLRPSLVWWLEKILDPVILKSDAWSVLYPSEQNLWIRQSN